MPFLYLHPYAIAMALFVVAFLGLGLVMLFSMAIGGSGETILIAFVPLLLGFFGNSTINGYLNTKAVSAVKLGASLHHFPRNSLRYTVLKGCIREQLKAAAPITYGELMTCGEYLRTAQKPEVLVLTQWHKGLSLKSKVRRSLGQALLDA